MMTAITVMKTTLQTIRKNIVNPRVALIYSLQPETTAKLIYGTAYRNANAYELYYGVVVGYLPSVDLKPEEVESYELDIEHYFYNNFKLTTSIYSNTTTNLIGLNSDISGDVFYDNVDKVTAEGVDLEAEYVADTGLRLRTSYSFVDTKVDNKGESLTNSPEHMVKFNLSSPVFKQKAKAGVEFQYMGNRVTPQGEKIGGFGITNLTLSSQKIYDRLELSASLYNVFEKRYADPASEEHIQSSMAQDGRSFRVKMAYTF